MFEVTSATLLVSLTSRQFADSFKAVKLLSFCVDCPSPEEQGSLAYGLTAKHGLQHYSVVGALIYCIPNFAESPKLLNSHELSERVVMVDRGKINIIDKVLKIQQHGAVAVIVADDGRCKNDFKSCGPLAGSAKEGGFAAHDDERSWKEVTIPVVVVSVETADKMRRMMGIEVVNIRKWGLNNVTVSIGGEEL